MKYNFVFIIIKSSLCFFAQSKRKTQKIGNEEKEERKTRRC